MHVHQYIYSLPAASNGHVVLKAWPLQITVLLKEVEQIKQQWSSNNNNNKRRKKIQILKKTIYILSN